MLLLFDELNLNKIELPKQLDSFIKFLENSYGLEQEFTQPLGHEAKLVHTLWHAWREQLQADKLIDDTTQYVTNLSQDIIDTNNANEYQLYLTGYCQFNQAEIQWLNAKLTQGNTHLIFQSNINRSFSDTETHPDKLISELMTKLDTHSAVITEHQADNPSPWSTCLDMVYNNTSLALKQRAISFAEKQADCPGSHHLAIYSAVNNETEAAAIDIQVRRWLLEGKKNIGIVTENRRLARRVRALLERSNISITDYSVWALSTSSAASVVERWLQCIEEDFAHEPLLDVLKSPFIFPDWTTEDRIRAAYRLENDIILHENIPQNLSRMRKQTQRRQTKLSQKEASYDEVFSLLDKLQAAAKPLLNYIGQTKHPTHKIIDGLLESLHILGIKESFTRDIAGECVINELEKMQQAALLYSTDLDWVGFRTWLGQTIENSNFQPSTYKSPVVLSGVTNSGLLSFDALIISAVEKEFMPGSTKISPFFNNSVRYELGLNSSYQNQNAVYYHFRRLLDTAPHILITHRKLNEGEPVIPSPWLEILLAFHKIAYDTDLSDPVLEALVNDPDTRITNCDIDQLPEIPEQPRAKIPAQFQPQTLSASSYQNLLDCPYKFFLENCLKLAPPDEIKLALEKSDYGSRVHLCLQAFHGDIKKFKGPFTQTLDKNSRDSAIGLLEEISSQVFADDLEDNFQHRGWLKKWTNLIPDYIDWQIQRSKDWHVAHVELGQTRETLIDNIVLTGKVDRIDENISNSAVIDYKTGAPPKQKLIENGEAVQLPFYALLTEEILIKEISQVAYLNLNKQPVKIRELIEGEQLTSLKYEAAQRLQTIINDLQAGKPAPAWGDKKTCEYCSMEGICRKSAWQKNWETEIDAKRGNERTNEQM